MEAILNIGHTEVVWLVAGLGVLWGSFANVLITRLPQGESIAWPGSHCRACQAAIKPWHNIPLVSYFWLRGKCATCEAPYSIRYPIIEAVMGVLFTFWLLRFGWSFQWLLWAGLMVFWVPLFWLDWLYFWLPDRLMFPSAVWVLGWRLVDMFRGWPVFEIDVFLSRMLGPFVVQSLIGLSPALGVWAIAKAFQWYKQKEGMGFGDIKLLAVMGLLLGWQGCMVAIMLASVLALSTGLPLRWLRNRWLGMYAQMEGVDPKAIPFGPFLMIASSWVGFAFERPVFALVLVLVDLLR